MGPGGRKNHPISIRWTRRQDWEKVAIEGGSVVAVRVGVPVGVRVCVGLGQRVSVGRVVGPVGVLVNVCVGITVRVGVTGLSVKVIVAVG